MRFIYGVAFAALAAGALPSSSHAASFDCAKANTDLEKAICANPELSDLDGQLGAKYTAALAQLTDRGKSILRDGERQWLHFVRAVCFDPKTTTGLSACLREKYHERLSDLDTAAFHIGNYVFSRRDRFISLPASQDTSDNRRPFEGHMSVIIIDAPQSTAIAAFNAEADARAREPFSLDKYCDAGAGDILSSFMLGHWGQNFVTVTSFDSSDCHGALHPNTDSFTAETYRLAPDLRKVEEADLFKPGSKWREFLVQKLIASGQIGDGAGVDPAVVDPIVGSPDGWDLSDDGLSISWLPSNRQAIVTIPWADLRPYLTPNLPE